MQSRYISSSNLSFASVTITSEMNNVFTMLKITFLSFLLFALLSCVFAKEKIETYDDKYDYIDFNAILGNPRLRDNYYNCFMDLGPCVTADQKFFREFIPEVFKTQCKKCTEKQKLAFDIISEFYSTKFPAKWEAIIQKYVVEPAGLSKP